jgi:hypothetical protein
MKRIIIALILLALASPSFEQTDNSEIVTGEISIFKIINQTNLDLTLKTIDWEGDQNIDSLPANNVMELAPMFLHLNNGDCVIEIYLIHGKHLIELSVSQTPLGVWMITERSLKEIAKNGFKIIR